jgi:hypothetical protein
VTHFMGTLAVGPVDEVALRPFGILRRLAGDTISFEVPLRMDFATRGFPRSFFTWDNNSSSDCLFDFRRRIKHMMAPER